MATDNDFLAIGGSGLETGVIAYGNPGFTLEVGVVGLGRTFGVVGGIDDGVNSPWSGLPAKASYALSAGVDGATATTVTGVAGVSGAGVGVFGQSGDFAPALPTATLAGVLGTAAHSAGVFGVSTYAAGLLGNSTLGPGVLGVSNNADGVQSTSTNGVGVHGQSTSFYAGVFDGPVAINGDLTVAGGFNLKGCAVPFPDGTYRVLYCMESPEVWFEDFGAARLRRGRAVVKLDADFAKVIKRGDYRVFLAAEGDCRGLYVRRKSAARFEVCELMGGKSSIPFSYRIVGRRKDVRDHTRFPRFDVPPSMLPTPRRRRRRSALGAPPAKVRKQAGARPGRARRRKTARAPLSLPALVAKARKRAGARAARRGSRR